MSRAWPCHAIDYVDGTPQPAFPPRLVYGAESVLTRCAIRLWTIRGTWPDDVLLGLWPRDSATQAWSLPSTPNAVIEAQARRQLAAVDGVVRVLEVVVSRPGTTIELAAKVEVSDGGEITQAVVGDLGVYDGTIPGAWYLILGTGHRPIYPLGSP